MSEDTKGMQRTAAQGVTVSRMIEYFPSAGESISRDCVYGGQKNTKGAIVSMSDGELYECTGDKDGSWKKVKKS